jgi:hypothetical protein
MECLKPTVGMFEFANWNVGNPAEAVGFLRAEKSSADLGPKSQICGM